MHNFLIMHTRKIETLIKIKRNEVIKKLITVFKQIKNKYNERYYPKFLLLSSSTLISHEYDYSESIYVFI